MAHSDTVTHYLAIFYVNLNLHRKIDLYSQKTIVLEIIIEIYTKYLYLCYFLMNMTMLSICYSVNISEVHQKLTHLGIANLETCKSFIIIFSQFFFDFRVT